MTPAKDLRPGDILEPDGTEVLSVKREGRTIAVKLKMPHCRAVWYALDPHWPLRRRLQCSGS